MVSWKEMDGKKEGGMWTMDGSEQVVGWKGMEDGWMEGRRWVDCWLERVGWKEFDG